MTQSLSPRPRGEEDVSHDLFEAATADPSIEVLSWQACDGKGYFAADIKLRLPTGERYEPDLILCDTSTVWIIEVKATHSDALADETKLLRLLSELGAKKILSLISLHSGHTVVGHQIELCVAYDRDDLGEQNGCEDMLHLEWQTASATIAADGLRAFLLGAKQ